MYNGFNIVLEWDKPRYKIPSKNLIETISDCTKNLYNALPELTEAWNIAHDLEFRRQKDVIEQFPQYLPFIMVMYAEDAFCYRTMFEKFLSREDYQLNSVKGGKTIFC